MKLMTEPVRNGAMVALYGVGGGVATVALSGLLFAFSVGIGWPITIDACMIAAGGLGWAQYFMARKRGGMAWDRIK